MATYKIYTLGCKVNQYDSGKLASELARVGLVMNPKNVDLAIINSCAVTKTAMIKSGRMIKLAKKENPKAKIALAGCWPKVSETKLEGVDFVSGGKEIIKQINRVMNQKLGIRNKVKNSNNKMIVDSGRSRYFIKIQDGCEQFCSYCIIPYARGKLTSRPVEEIIAEIKQAVKAGYGEIVLSGIHLGLYQTTEKKNLDSPPAFASAKGRGNDKRGLTSLIKEIIKIKNLGRIRLSSIEITEVTDELINLMVKSKKICRHLHIPLQSGSDKILKLMNRPYNTEYFKNKIERIRRSMSNIAITTDVIVGFPGESDQDFCATVKFIKRIKFNRLHVFPFSAHERTPAAKMPNQIEEKNKARRAEILRDLSVKLADSYKKKFKGKELDIVIEQIKQNKIIGKSEYYFEVIAYKKKFKNKNLRAGETAKVKI